MPIEYLPTLVGAVKKARTDLHRLSCKQEMNRALKFSSEVKKMVVRGIENRRSADWRKITIGEYTAEKPEHTAGK